MDGIRDAPPGWMRAFTPEQVVGLLSLGRVAEVSLDHELGLDDGVSERTGCVVLYWLAREVGTGRWIGPLPKISLHSRDRVGRDRMLRVVHTIDRLHALAELRANGSGSPGPI